MRSVLGLLFGVLLIWMSTAQDTSHDDRAHELHRDGARSTGTVVELSEQERTRHSGGRRNRSSTTSTVQCPRISFSAAGTEHAFVEHDDCDRLEVGDEVSVMYDPEDPYGARLDSEAVLAERDGARVLSWWLVGLGSLFTVVSAVGLVTRVRRRWGSARTG